MCNRLPSIVGMAYRHPKGISSVKIHDNMVFTAASEVENHRQIVRNGQSYFSNGPSPLLCFHAPYYLTCH